MNYKLMLNDKQVNGNNTTIDTELSSSSNNPISNKAVTEKVGTTDISSISDGTITGAINEINEDLSNKQSSTDNSLNTTNKTIAGAISELNSALTDLESRQGVSNPNLIDNPFFTVNQRGQSEYTTVGYTVDRWKIINSGLTVNVNDDNTISLSIVSNASRVYRQSLNESIPVGTNLTLSVCAKGTGSCRLFYSNTSAGSAINFANDNFETKQITVLTTKTVVGVEFKFSTTSEQLTVKCVKLERGSVSTLHLDTAPDYYEELERCYHSTADSADTYANGYNPIISDAWVQRTWNVGEYCIHDNKLWKCLVSNTNPPSEGTEWTRTSVSTELIDRNIRTINYMGAQMTWQESVINMFNNIKIGQACVSSFDRNGNNITMIGFKYNATRGNFLVFESRLSTAAYSVRFDNENSFYYSKLNGGTDTKYPS